MTEEQDIFASLNVSKILVAILEIHKEIIVPSKLFLDAATVDKELQDKWNLMQQAVVNNAEHAYNWAIQSGIAKEQARAVLPEGNTQSRLYMNGTLRSWIHYCQLRMENGTQKEHAEIANECWDIIAAQFPNVATALEQQ